MNVNYVRIVLILFVLSCQAQDLDTGVDAEKKQHISNDTEASENTLTVSVHDFVPILVTSSLTIKITHLDLDLYTGLYIKCDFFDWSSCVAEGGCKGLHDEAVVWFETWATEIHLHLHHIKAVKEGRPLLEVKLMRRGTLHAITQVSMFQIGLPRQLKGVQILTDNPLANESGKWRLNLLLPHYVPKGSKLVLELVNGHELLSHCHLGEGFTRCASDGSNKLYFELVEMEEDTPHSITTTITVPSPGKTQWFVYVEHDGLLISSGSMQGPEMIQVSSVRGSAVVSDPIVGKLAVHTLTFVSEDKIKPFSSIYITMDGVLDFSDCGKKALCEGSHGTAVIQVQHVSSDRFSVPIMGKVIKTAMFPVYNINVFSSDVLTHVGRGMYNATFIKQG